MSRRNARAARVVDEVRDQLAGALAGKGDLRSALEKVLVSLDERANKERLLSRQPRRADAISARDLATIRAIADALDRERAAREDLARRVEALEARK